MLKFPNELVESKFSNDAPLAGIILIIILHVGNKYFF